MTVLVTQVMQRKCISLQYYIILSYTVVSGKKENVHKQIHSHGHTLNLNEANINIFVWVCIYIYTYIYIYIFIYSQKFLYDIL